MRTTTTSKQLTFQLDPTNPGQYFACCGLLELASRMWPSSTTGCFANGGRSFHIDVAASDEKDPRAHLIERLAACQIDNVMTAAQKARLEILSAMKKKDVEEGGLEEEKKLLESLRREAPVTIGPPFNLTIDWHQDDRAGGSNFKTWAGQQSIIDIAEGMQAALRDALKGGVEPEQLFLLSSRSKGLPFNFDANLGAQSAALDVGFSFDPLPGLSVGTRPAIELCAFVGLERFRPVRVMRENRYRYAAWATPLEVNVASAAASGQLDSAEMQIFEFRLLYRTKYLKSFLVAKPIGGES
jgi:CRISPR-associated protein Csb3